MLDPHIMQDAFEIAHYDHPDIPIYIKDDNLSEYTDRRGLCHWHDDIELIYIAEGRMNYHINGRPVLLKEEDCLIINSRQLHYGSSCGRYNCRFICIRFHPKILEGSEGICKKYVLPFISCGKIEYLYYDSCSLNHDFVRKCVRSIFSLKDAKEDAYELEVLSIICRLWRRISYQCRNRVNQESAPDCSDLALQKRMVSYIYEHYREPLTLDEIAACANISRSKCCTIFKEYLQQSPIDYLNKYRLELSCYLLANTQSKVTDIALSCGFSHLSYFSRIFLREYGCTPTKYRKQHEIYF